MASSVTLHIGPMKTASTSVQHILRLGYSRLLAHDTLYPGADRLEHPHHGATVDLFRELGFPPTVDRLHTEVIAHQQWAAPGTWQALVRRVHEFPGHVILSSEQLCEIPVAGVALIRRDFADTPVTAVVVHRSPAELLPSLYQEKAKRLLMDDFESYVRRALPVLLSGSDVAPAWLDSAWIARTWRTGGIPVHIVDASTGLSDDVVFEVVRRLAPGVDLPGESVRFNESISAWCVEAWQQHVRSVRPKYLGASMAVLSRLTDMGDVVTDTTVGGGYQLLPEVKELVESSFPGPSRKPDIHSRSELQTRLSAPHPITQRTVGSAEPGPDVTQRVLNDLQRWNRVYTMKWRAAEAVRRIQGGPAPTRNVWREPA